MTFTAITTTYAPNDVIPSAWANIIGDNFDHLRALVPDAVTAGTVLVAASATTANFAQLNNIAFNDGQVNARVLADEAVETAKIKNANVTAAKLASDVAIVPSGLIGAFATAAAIASGWARYTAADGRIMVGAGTTYGATFSENSDAGTASWAHLHDGSTLTTAATTGGSIESGSGSTANPSTHTHGVTGNTANTTWIPPVRVVVWAQKA